MASAWYITFISLLQASRFQHTAWKLPCWALIVDLDVRRKRTMNHLANFYSLITFIGPQSHLRNHGDADKVTHDYSSMAEADWANPRLLPKEPCRSVFINSLCPCSTFVHLWVAKKRLCHSQFISNFWSCPPPPLYSPINRALWILQPFLCCNWGSDHSVKLSSVSKLHLHFMVKIESSISSVPAANSFLFYGHFFPPLSDF